MKSLELAHVLAKKLLSSDELEECNRLYVGVMPQDLSIGGCPAGILPAIRSAAETPALPVIALLMCADKEPILAVTFEKAVDFPQLDCICLDADHSASELCAQICQAYQMALCRLYLDDDFCELQVLPEKQFPEQTLCRTGAVTQDGTVTPYGTYCGLVTLYKLDDEQQLIITRQGAYNAAARIYDSLFPVRDTPARPLISLRERQFLLEKGFPCDEGYGDLVTDQLRSLLKTPLKAYFTSEKFPKISELYPMVCACLDRLRKLGAVFDDPVTFGELLQCIWDICSTTHDKEGCFQAMRDVCTDLLVYLAKPACLAAGEIKEDYPPRLCYHYRRLARGKKDWGLYSPFWCPIKHYILSAGRIRGSMYPIWIYNRVLYGRLDMRRLSVERDQMPVMLLERACRFRQDHSEESFLILYNLLVLPFADQKLQTSAQRTDGSNLENKTRKETYQCLI